VNKKINNQPSTCINLTHTCIKTEQYNNLLHSYIIGLQLNNFWRKFLK